MEKKITVIIQARMASTRLPGKVLMEVLERPLLSYLIERLQQSCTIGDIVLATTINSVDDPVALLGEMSGLPVYRGSESNVLDRFYGAATAHKAKHIMRITADCPLIDPDFLDALAEYYRFGQFDYASNCLEPTLPDGLDAEIFTFQALEYAHRHAIRPSCREHVTPYIRNHPGIFSIGSWHHSDDLSHLRWTVDESEDFQFVQRVIGKLYPADKNFRTRDILSLLCQKPELMRINHHIARNEGYAASLGMEKISID